MGGGNGAKSAQKRERNAAKAPKGESSQLKSNQAAQSIQCFTCKATFQGTSKQLVLQQHIDSKHPKSDIKTCFPNFVIA
ncbi:hypothetical protein CI109_100532 [Kwoniella shandongensis]|uniref:Uncharacterized protein n=1 Tax=Kwoniella shandongensis TaxID=1734106 RepID=A0A5M6BZE6_9TREE|nr:uncharacterized protein CI109_003547 [Kwoniella shandongensis]KAA5528258.1 hypothetical protein CI109_003547 [Kwoniella shandongensis]